MKTIRASHFHEIFFRFTMGFRGTESHFARCKNETNLSYQLKSFHIFLFSFYFFILKCLINNAGTNDIDESTTTERCRWRKNC